MAPIEKIINIDLNHLLKVLIIIAMLSTYIPWNPENMTVSKIRMFCCLFELVLGVLENWPIWAVLLKEKIFLSINRVFL